MKTEDLIARLAERAVRGQSPGTVLGAALASGVLVSLAIMMAWLGPRPDISVAISTAAFWMKMAYATALAAASWISPG